MRSSLGEFSLCFYIKRVLCEDDASNFCLHFTFIYDTFHAILGIYYIGCCRCNLFFIFL
jgi:hypothetical protein